MIGVELGPEECAVGLLPSLEENASAQLYCASAENDLWELNQSRTQWSFSSVRSNLCQFKFVKESHLQPSGDEC